MIQKGDLKDDLGVRMSGDLYFMLAVAYNVVSFRPN
jgi:hypothetical protein